MVLFSTAKVNKISDNRENKAENIPPSAVLQQPNKDKREKSFFSLKYKKNQYSYTLFHKAEQNQKDNVSLVFVKIFTALYFLSTELH